MNVTVRSINNAPAISAAIRALSEKRVLVGIPAADAGRQPEPGEPAPKINNAALAYIHEHGAPEVNIPARPFLLPGVESAKDQIEAGLVKAGKAALAGNAGEVDRQLNIVGLRAQTAVKLKINDGPFVPLAPLTLAARRRRGRTGIKPLIDTGQLRNAINYVIRIVKGK